MKIIKGKFMITIVATLLLLVLRMYFNKNDKLKKIITNLLWVDYILITVDWQILFGFSMIVLNMYNSPGFGRDYKFKIEDCLLLILAVTGLVKLIAIIVLLIKRNIKKFYKIFILSDIVSIIILLYYIFFIYYK